MGTNRNKKKKAEESNSKRIVKIIVIEITVIIIILASIYLFRPVVIEHYPSYLEQKTYTNNLYYEYNGQNFFNASFLPNIFGMHKIGRQILASLEYSWDSFQSEFAKDPHLKTGILSDLEQAHREFSHDYNKALYYLKNYEQTYLENINKFDKTRGNKVKLGIQLSYGSIYRKLKQFDKAIEIYKRIPEAYPYQIRKGYDTQNLWVDVYQYIADIYTYKLHDWEKAKVYYKKMAVDLTKLPSERIASLDVFGAVTSADLKYLSDRNSENAINQMYYASRDLGKHKEAQQILVDDLKSMEINSNDYSEDCYSFKKLINERKYHGVKVKYKPKNIRRLHPTIPQKTETVSFSVYLEEQKQLYKQGKPSNWKWL